MTRIYYIGGSPCSGKSTIAENLAKRYNLFYYKVDDYLDKYIEQGAKRYAPICTKQKQLSSEQIWMRDPELQCREEFQLYSEIIDDIILDIYRIQCKSDIITEGATYCPQLMKKLGINQRDYMAIIPDPEFQVTHYKQRQWVPYILDGCSNKQQAFSNWMQRDILFADKVKTDCIQQENYFLINNGKESIEELILKVSMHFGLEK